MPPPPPPPPVRGKGTTTAPNKEANEYIPNFISKRPFYAGEGDEETDYLEHQRLHKKQQDTAWYDRGKKGTAATKYRKGACENCGAMGHKAKDCLERPRKKGAKWTGKNIQADDVEQEVHLSWDAKRDRWNGYDAKEYKHVVEEYEAMEELKKQAHSKQKGEGGEDDEDDEGLKYAETNDMSKHQPTSTRQLRIREDTAKYLLNLDLESAKYDPKTRTLVDGGAMADKAADVFNEEGFVRASGDAAEFERATRYAWEAQENKGDTSQHIQANPTAGEFYRRKEREEAEQKRLEKEKALREKYGDEAAHTMPAALQSMAVTESEQFVEYDEHGLVKGAKSSAKSKYAEDVYINNHTSVWGSWWSNFQWGFACCHSTIKNSYCTGEDGKKAWEASEQQRNGATLLENTEEIQEEEPPADEKEDTGKEKQNLKRSREEMAAGVTEEELDEYRRKRTAADDPMAKFLGKDELVN
ncbi:mRNA splicing protein [Gnomoniopsis sp. IMI 355080]|nr:mRNA splicing protein [Gnomoniopsis sp. IMI 355080]